MDTVHAPGSDAARITLELLDDLFGHGGDVGVRLWDGTRWPDERPRAATLVLRHPGALRAMFRAGTELALSEAYLHDDFDIEGDIFAVHVLADTITGRTTDVVTKGLPVRRPRPAARGVAAGGRPGAGPAHGAAALGGARPRGNPVPLRRLERFLPGVPRRPHGLLLRVLRRRRDRPRDGAARQARPGLPQAAPEARAAPARHRLRLGRPGDARGARVRRRRHRHHPEPSAVRTGRRAHRGRRPGEDLPRSATSITATWRRTGPGTRSSAWECSSTSAERCSVPISGKPRASWRGAACS